MTTYATTTDVQNRFPWLTFGVSSKPTLTTVEDMIEEVEEDIEAAMKTARFATIPATDANDITHLRGKVVDIVKARAWVAAYGSDRIPDWVDRAEARYDKWLDKLERGRVSLPAQNAQRGMGMVALRRRDEDTTSEYSSE